MKKGLLVLVAIVLSFSSVSFANAPEFASVDTGTGPDLLLPEGYSYEILISEGMLLSDGNSFGGDNDMNAFVPISDGKAYLAVNHESIPGGMSVLTLEKQNDKWMMTEGRKVDFSSVGGTIYNCSGNPSPWGTVFTAEEWAPTPDDEDWPEASKALTDAGLSGDRMNYGWMVEVNPVTLEVKKIKAMGRFDHESIAFMPDQQTMYLTDDIRGGHFYKFVADKPADVSSGTLYALDAVNRKWIEIPEDRLDDTRTAAAELGATGFDRPEDVEYNPVDGMIYWVETGDNRKEGQLKLGRVNVFNPETLENKAFVQGSMEGIINPDNIAIEPVTGRVFIQEDRYDEFMAPTEGMPNASLWVAETDGTINRFANMPFASEVTGGAFAPDGTLFFNVQHPEAPWKASVVQVIAPK